MPILASWEIKNLILRSCSLIILHVSTSITALFSLQIILRRFLNSLQRQIRNFVGFPQMNVLGETFYTQFFQHKEYRLENSLHQIRFQNEFVTRQPYSIPEPTCQKSPPKFDQIVAHDSVVETKLNGTNNHLTKRWSFNKPVFDLADRCAVIRQIIVSPKCFTTDIEFRAV